jgi:hypothetical protein
MKLNSRVLIAVLGMGLLLLSALPVSASQNESNPYAFSLFAPGYLKVTDVLMPGDYFRIWNFGALLGETQWVPWADVVYESDPSLAFLNPNLSHGVFALPAGSYDLRFQNIFLENGMAPLPPAAEGLADFYYAVDESPQGPAREWNMLTTWADVSSADIGPGFGFTHSTYTQPIPEPGTFALLGLGLAAAGLVMRRKR